MGAFQFAKDATRYFPANRPVLPEWTRFAWASTDEYAWWQYYLNNIIAMLTEVEKESVARGIRGAAWITCDPQDLTALANWGVKNDCVVIPRERLGVGPTSSEANMNPGAHWQYRALVVRRDRLNEVPALGAHEKLGTLLGYPTCCVDFFKRTWAKHQVDTTYDQYMSTGSADGPLEANMLWRWLGPRWVFHLPCSFQCKATIDMGAQHRQLALELGYVEEVAALNSILQWPVHWSAVNGIGVIVGPCARISTRTDWSPEPRQFFRQGTYHRPEAWYWTDNGFAVPDGMHRAHGTVIKALTGHLSQKDRIVDLGCGNGLLLRRLKMRRKDVAISGVDINETAVMHARQHLVGKWNVGNLNICDWPNNPNVAILSANRLSPDEMTREDAAHVREALRKMDRVFVTAYGDNLIKSGSLQAICAEAGLPANPAIVGASPDAVIGMFKGTEL